MDFSEALKALKMGSKVCRTGWDGNGLWVAIRDVSGIQPFFIISQDGGRQINTWVPSSADLMASDWMVIV